MKKFHGYIDIRNDNNQPFYVGIGTMIRVKETKRNRHHTRVANKYGLTRIIMISSDDRKDVEEWELKIIAKLRMQFTLTNMTDGGEKNAGYKMTEEDIKKSTRSGSDHWAYGKPSPKRGTKHTHETKLKMRRAVRERNERKRLEKLNK